MKTLADLMNNEIKKLQLKNFKTLKDFINDDKSSSNFIKVLLDDDDYVEVDEISPIYTLAEARARHSAITFLLGKIFYAFEDLSIFFASDILKNVNNKDLNSKLWLLISLYHDYGYSSTLILNENLNYEKIIRYYLLTDNYQETQLDKIRDFAKRQKKTLAYTYSEILDYDKYARNYHKEHKDKEKIDHGILGGVIVFDRLVKKAIKFNSYNDLEIIKVINLIIAQHNIYKSSNSKDDKAYPESLKKLKHFSSFKIDTNTPLLLFLSLVDTLECVKRFSKSYNKAENQFLKTMTVLNSIKLEVTEKTIVIDYSVLKQELDNKKGLDFEAYFNAVLNLRTWTKFNTKKNSDTVLSISLKKTK